MDQKSFLLHYYVLIIFDVDCYINKKSRTCRRVVDFPGGSVVKNLPAMQETQVRSLGWEDPLEEEMATHFSNLAGKSHGQRNLVGYGPWGRRVGHN